MYEGVKRNIRCPAEKPLAAKDPRFDYQKVKVCQRRCFARVRSKQTKLFTFEAYSPTKMEHKFDFDIYLFHFFEHCLWKERLVSLVIIIIVIRH